jgi:hypothetical protein
MLQGRVVRKSEPSSGEADAPQLPCSFPVEDQCETGGDELRNTPDIGHYLCKSLLSLPRPASEQPVLLGLGYDHERIQLYSDRISRRVT